MKNQEFDHRFEHARFSLSNIQNNIRFIDRKVAGGMGIVAIALGFFISRSLIVKQLVLRDQGVKWIIRAEWVFLVLAAVSLAVAMVYAARTLFPRQAKDPRLVRKNWVLFPMATKAEEVVLLCDEISKKLCETMSDDMILKEYAEQIATTGHIQTLKMSACKKMFVAIWAFCALVLVLGMLSLLCYVEYMSPKLYRNPVIQNKTIECS